VLNRFVQEADGGCESEGRRVAALPCGESAENENREQAVLGEVDPAYGGGDEGAKGCQGAEEKEKVGEVGPRQRGAGRSYEAHQGQKKTDREERIQGCGDGGLSHAAPQGGDEDGEKGESGEHGGQVEGEGDGGGNLHGGKKIAQLPRVDNDGGET